MYPTLFRIPYLDFPISTFGLMMAVAFLVGSWITAKRMAEEGLDPDALEAELGARGWTREDLTTKTVMFFCRKRK